MTNTPTGQKHPFPHDRDWESGEASGASQTPLEIAKLNEDLLSPELSDGQLDGEETRSFDSARHTAVSSLLSNLAKTARSFILYDPRNDAIRNFLTALLESSSATLKQTGDLQAVIQPFEIWFEGEVVYLNRDRDRSLAFRLYRDGVRCLTIHPGFDWGELLQLLQILSIRYTGVHQYEDDVVTLLWKANFNHLDVVAVEGFAPCEDDRPEDGHSTSASSSSTLPDGDDIHMPEELCATSDRAAPHLPDFESPAWLEVPADKLDLLRNEGSDHGLPPSCLALLKRIRALLDDSSERWHFLEVSHLFAETRDFLLASEQLTHLEQLIDMLEEMSAIKPPAWDPWRQDVVRKILSGCGDDRAIRKLLHTAAVDSRVIPPELIRLTERLCPNPLNTILDTFLSERSGSARAFARQLIEHFGRGHVEELRERFLQLPGTLATDLLRAIAHMDLENSAAFIAQQCWHPDPEVQDEALRHLEHIPYTGALGRHLFEAVCRVDPVRRLKVFKLILRSKDTRFVDRMARYIGEQGNAMPAADAEQFGRIMGRLGGESSLPLWAVWLAPSGWLRKSLQGSPARQVAAAAALGEIPSEKAGEILQEAADVSEGSPASEWINRAIARHGSA